MSKKTDFCFSPGVRALPYSPEAVFRYVQFLVSQGRIADALLIAQTADAFSRPIEPAINFII